jgi:hypothetical protein
MQYIIWFRVKKKEMENVYYIKNGFKLGCVKFIFHSLKNSMLFERRMRETPKLLPKAWGLEYTP